ncbi:GntR family transcriptional regulator [Acuticoccus sediminis]|uniref:GntR family transcriptional regulator n=1 Tax=Acuticoccus sediminis TaxID=2184697 RepID=UPI001CFD593B|nr:GntR family transcriptional regulator [Acuticoccus sediminis]
MNDYDDNSAAPVAKTASVVPTTAALVADRVEAGILRGDFSPGAPLRELTLAKRFEASRSTVREALRLLTDTGLVMVSPRHGAEVVAVSATVVHEVYTLRATLEAFAVRLAINAGRMHGEHLEAIEAAYAALCEAAERTDPVAQIEADMDFHLALCQPCGHGLLLHHLKQLQARTRLCILYTKIYRSDAESEALSHRPILAAVRAAEIDSAENALREHILGAGQRLLVRIGEATAQPAPGRRRRTQDAG